MESAGDTPGRPPRSQRAIVVLGLIGAALVWLAGLLALTLLQGLLGFLLDLWGLLTLLLFLLGAGAFLAALIVRYLRRKPSAPAGAGATIESLQTRQL